MKKEKQISFRVEQDFARQIEAWRIAEDISEADFVRKLLRVAAALYDQTGSLHELKRQYGEGARAKTKRA
jgi:hypothetical protein